ncbi:MAG: hypothetical protein ABJ246_08710 [Paracoccaceae bacterium]
MRSGIQQQRFDTIDKTALLKLLDLYLENEAELDSPDDQSLSNQAHAIIYRGIFDKLLQLADKKSRFKDESETLYLDEMEKYAAQ